jgi:hypothetical protein
VYLVNLHRNSRLTLANWLIIYTMFKTLNVALVLGFFVTFALSSSAASSNKGPVFTAEQTQPVVSSPAERIYRLRICQTRASWCVVFESLGAKFDPRFQSDFLASVGMGFGYVLTSDYVWTACVYGVDTQRNGKNFGPGGTFCRYVGGGSTMFAAENALAGTIRIVPHQPLVRDRSQLPKGYWRTTNIVTLCSDEQAYCSFEEVRQNAKCAELGLGPVVKPAVRWDKPGRSGMFDDEEVRYENADTRKALDRIPAGSSRWGKLTGEWSIYCSADRYFNN